MSINDPHPPPLRLIPGGRHRSFTVNNIAIVPAPEDDPPFAVDAVVLEEDTYLVTSADSVVKPPKDHPVKIYTDTLEQQPLTPGSVVVREGSPLRLLAVVHDFNREPSWQPEWVATALDNLFTIIGERDIDSMTLPLLGHPRTFATVMEVLDRFLSACERREQAARALRVWLAVPSAYRRKIMERLESR